MKLPMYICKIMQQCNSGPYFKTIGVHIDSAVGFYSFCCCIFGNRRCKKHAKGNRIIINLLPLCWALMQMMLYGYINMHILVQIWIISKYIIILLFRIYLHLVVKLQMKISQVDAYLTNVDDQYWSMHVWQNGALNFQVLPRFITFQ